MIREMRVQLGTLVADIGLIKIPKNNLKYGKNNESIDTWLSNLSQPFNMNSHRPSVVKITLWRESDEGAREKLNKSFQLVNTDTEDAEKMEPDKRMPKVLV
ncbi:hypothetical protein QQ045_022070 [Rhodiola kirilowii]